MTCTRCGTEFDPKEWHWCPDCGFNSNRDWPSYAKKYPEERRRYEAVTKLVAERAQP